MNIYNLSIDDVKIISPDVHEDHRGYLVVPIVLKSLSDFEIDFKIVQINQGYSRRKHTIRGMHFQSPPYEQAKLISANMGSFYSVAVDLRQGSPTFGQWCGEEISLENHKVMYVPRGFAHGYLTLEDNTILQYCVDNEYCAGNAKALKYNDTEIGINWPVKVDKSTLTHKDLNALSLDEIRKGNI